MTLPRPPSCWMRWRTQTPASLEFRVSGPRAGGGCQRPCAGCQHAGGPASWWYFGAATPPPPQLAFPVGAALMRTAGVVGSWGGFRARAGGCRGVPQHPLRKGGAAWPPLCRRPAPLPPRCALHGHCFQKRVGGLRYEAELRGPPPARARGRPPLRRASSERAGAAAGPRVLTRPRRPPARAQPTVTPRRWTGAGRCACCTWRPGAASSSRTWSCKVGGEGEGEGRCRGGDAGPRGVGCPPEKRSVLPRHASAQAAGRPALSRRWDDRSAGPAPPSVGEAAALVAEMPGSPLWPTADGEGEHKVRALARAL